MLHCTLQTFIACTAEGRTKDIVIETMQEPCWKRQIVPARQQGFDVIFSASLHLLLRFDNVAIFIATSCSVQGITKLLEPMEKMPCLTTTHMKTCNITHMEVCRIKVCGMKWLDFSSQPGVLFYFSTASKACKVGHLVHPLPYFPFDSFVPRRRSQGTRSRQSFPSCSLQSCSAYEINCILMIGHVRETYVVRSLELASGISRISVSQSNVSTRESLCFACC